MPGKQPSTASNAHTTQATNPGPAGWDFYWTGPRTTPPPLPSNKRFDYTHIKTDNGEGGGRGRKESRTES